MCKKAKELRRQLEIIYMDVWQDRPNTAVSVTAWIEGGEIYHAYGFSKVCRPDRWNKQRGLEIARGKAEAKIVRQILAQERQSKRAAFVEAFANQIAGEAVDANASAG